MPVIDCPDCGGKVSTAASACPHCGRPMSAQPTQPQQAGSAKCPSCGRMVNPVVTSVGGGSCSVGSREKWTCPACRAVMHRSGCFIATASYEDEDAVEVRFLRLFRDRVLSRSTAGRGLIAVYYFVSPVLALAICHSKIMRRIGRLGLDLVVESIEKRVPFSRREIRRKLSEHRARRAK